MTAPFVEIYNKPGRLECIRRGWHRGHCTFDIIKQFEEVKAAASWIKESIDKEDYVLFPGGFKIINEQKYTLFLLRWS